MLPPIPQQYVEYLNSNGAFEGFTHGDAEPGYVALWALDNLADYNADVEIEVYAPGFIAFGGNGGGELLVFDASGAVFMLPMIGMEPQYAMPVADSFQGLAARFQT
ncbi:SMI1/KNR4 family protein [Ralstonia pseudosolanacearum]|uniref:SMI1/KNR4 family protein n=1 Tax=Ralstonia pseudosolanacearum TaxID=1310165 RepID=UPI0039C5C4FA